MSRERQKQQSEEVRTSILNIARRIVAEQGVEALSIRRITKEMDYSAGIVYHYYKNKEEILLCILQEGYARIIQSIQVPDGNLTPDEAIRVSFTNYIKGALQWPAEYKAIMLDSSPSVLEFTAVLGEGFCKKRPALQKLVSILETGVSEGLFAPCDVQVTAQVIWSAMFGLLIRLIIERDVTPKQRKKLIEGQINMILKGLRP